MPNQMQWQFDAPTGTYKSHAMSKRLFEAAVENSKFMDHVTPIDGFGKKQGESVTLTRIAALAEPTSGVLTEGERIPEDSFSITTTSITVSEFGRSVPYTSLMNDLSHVDYENIVQRKLREQLTLSLDTLFASAYKTAKIKYIPTGATAATIATGGSFTTSALVNMNVYHVEEIVDYLVDTLYVDPVGDDFIGIFRRLSMRGIKRDVNWETWHKYTDPMAKYNGEVGRLEGMRFIETNHANALGKVGTGSVLGEGVCFGQDSVAVAEAEAPELRAAIPGDFGRSKAVAWYGILQAGLIWDTANAGEAKVIHVGSS